MTRSNSPCRFNSLTKCSVTSVVFMGSWLTEKQTSIQRDPSRQLAVICLAVFPAILILPQLVWTKESFKNNWYFLLVSRWCFRLCRFITKLWLCSSPATPKFLPDTLSIKIPLISLQLLTHRGITRHKEIKTVQQFNISKIFTIHYGLFFLDIGYSLLDIGYSPRLFPLDIGYFPPCGIPRLRDGYWIFC